METSLKQVVYRSKHIAMRKFIPPHFIAPKLLACIGAFLPKISKKVCTVFRLLSSRIVLRSSQLITENVALTIINNYRRKTISQKGRS